MPLDSDADLAKTLTILAMAIQALFFLLGVFMASFLLPIQAVGPGGFMMFPMVFSSFLFGFGFLIGILWILMDYLLVYRPLAESRVQSAESSSIVLGILQLIFGGLIPGILLIVAWVKIRDSLRRPPAL
ncbi:MAG: hypothetical protein JRN29_05330 [Nitrososphaerota archaeon]|nr:hypothetical protein [Nitrososphaerota archaeon]